MFEPVDDELDLALYPALANSRGYSTKLTRAVTTALTHFLEALDEPVMTVAVAGSLGRLEASPQSDIDCMIVVDDGANFHPQQTAASIDRIRDEFVRRGLELP